VKQEYLSVMEPFVRRLAKFGLLSRRGNSIDPTQHTKFGLLQARNEFRQNPPARYLGQMLLGRVLLIVPRPDIKRKPFSRH
jgi:hypothetical protein